LVEGVRSLVDAARYPRQKACRKPGRLRPRRAAGGWLLFPSGAEPDWFGGAREILLNIVATEGVALSATETIAAAQEKAGSLATLVPLYEHVARQHAEARYRDAAAAVFGSASQKILTDQAWDAVVGRVYDAETTSGWQPAQLLAIAKTVRELDSANSPAEVLTWRIDAILADTPEPPRPGQRYESPAAAKERLAAVATSVLGSRDTERARSETAWPALIAALRRAERDGHDLARLLAEVSSARELRTARSVSEVLTGQRGPITPS
jgi:hypothetical protein